MSTLNNELVCMAYADLKKLIQEEVAKFGEELGKWVQEVKRNQNIEKKPLSITQVAERYNVSKKTVHNWMSEGMITGFKVGKSRFFYTHELDDKLKQYRYTERLKVNKPNKRK